MDVLSVGCSTTFDSTAAAYSTCVSSCTFSFQGFENFSSLCFAVEDLIVKHTGLVVRIGDALGLLNDGVTIGIFRPLWFDLRWRLPVTEPCPTSLNRPQTFVLLRRFIFQAIFTSLPT